jgi:hypothetical protein
MYSAEDFYKKRDQRTNEYAGEANFNAFSIFIAIDDQSSRSAAGQMALISLVNQLARVHRNITVSIPTSNIPLALKAPINAQTLQGTLLETAKQIDPYGVFHLSSDKPVGSVSFGIGNPNIICDWFIGADGAIAILEKTPQEINLDKPSTIKGAALASCLGAATAFKSQIGATSVPRRLSAWNFEEGKKADAGPDDLL